MPDTRLEDFLTNSFSVTGAYIALNTTLKNFLVLVHNNSRLLPSFQKASEQSLIADIQSISDNNTILGDGNKLMEQKSEFLKMIESTHHIHFTESQKSFLIKIIQQFYDIQIREFELRHQEKSELQAP